MHESKTVRTVIATLAVVIAVLAIFSLGMRVGARQARFAGSFGQSYEQNFRGPMGGGKMMVGFFDEGLPSGHGAVGKVVSLNLPELVVAGPDNFEKIVLTGTSTEIRKFRDTVNANEIKTDDFVVVIGNPNDKGQIEAKLIRIMPKPYEN